MASHCGPEYTPACFSRGTALSFTEHIAMGADGIGTVPSTTTCRCSVKGRMTRGRCEYRFSFGKHWRFVRRCSCLFRISVVRPDRRQ
jgi:hypothetical protein